MPAGKLAIWKQERDIWLKHHPEPWDDNTQRRYHRRFTDQLEKWLDQGAGSCLLKEEKNRQFLEQTLMHDHATESTITHGSLCPTMCIYYSNPSSPCPNSSNPGKVFLLEK